MFQKTLYEDKYPTCTPPHIFLLPWSLTPNQLLLPPPPPPTQVCHNYSSNETSPHSGGRGGDHRKPNNVVSPSPLIMFPHHQGHRDLSSLSRHHSAYAGHIPPTETNWCWRPTVTLLSRGCRSLLPWRLCLSPDCSPGFYSFLSSSGISAAKLRDGFRDAHFESARPHRLNLQKCPRTELPWGLQ